MLFLKTTTAWITSHFNQKSNDDITDNISLEALNNKIRLVVWLFLLIHILTVTFFSHTRLPIPYYLFVYVVWIGYLCLLIKGKSELIKGIPFIIVNFGTALILVQKGESYYLRLMTFSLPSLPVYSVQGFPPILTLVLGIGYYGLHQNYFHYLSAFYEPITQTYRIPELALHHTLTGYRVGLFLEIFCLVMYQIVVQRIWKNYQIAKKNIQDTNTKLQKVNIQLAKHIEELAELNRQLNAHQYQDLFVACVSHELRNPLNVMLGSLDLLEPHIKGPAEAHLLKTCRVCGDVLLSHINNLLDVAKINADKVEINEFVTNMSTFLEKFWAFARIGLEKKHLQGCLCVDKNLSLWLNIDSYRLHQILNNLIGNAIKFTKEGSVRVTLRCLKGAELGSNKLLSYQEDQENEQKIEEKKAEAEDSDDMNEGQRQQTNFSQVSQKKNNSRDFLNFKLDDPVRDMLESILPSSDESDDNFLKIEIVDTGCGIPQESLQSVFEPFVLGDRSVTRKYGGTGLGLYIVKSLVNKMGGDIKMTSLKDVGTHFQIILPVKSAKRVHTSKHLASTLPLSRVPSIASLCGVSDTTCSSKSRASSKRVLIVDDDPFNQTLLKEYFKKFEYECDTADNGLEGLETYKSSVYKYSFITMDIQMPIMDGITACKKIREFEKEAGHSRVPLVIVTGNYSEDERKMCLDNEEIQESLEQDDPSYKVPKEMIKEDMTRVLDEHKTVALNAKEVGFDGVELHGGNEFLMFEFIQDGVHQITMRTVPLRYGPDLAPSLYYLRKLEDYNSSGRTSFSSTLSHR